MGASKSSNSSEFEEDRPIGREKEDESTVQNLHKASSDVTADDLQIVDAVSKFYFLFTHGW